MKLTLLTIFAALTLSVSISQADSCSKEEIGKKVDLQLLQSDGTTTAKSFVVQSCTNNIYSANEQADQGAILKFKAGQGDLKKIRIFSTAQGDNFSATISGTWNVKTQQVTFSQPMADVPECPAGYHWDPEFEECLPDNPNQCPPGQHHDPTMGGMCMADVMFNMNQFLVYTDGSGPRGRSAFTAPNMWMLMVNKATSEKNQVGLMWMGTTDKWTVPSNGTPELLQTGESNKEGKPFIDAQHPHSSPIMGLTFSDILTLDKDGKKNLTFFFAPRGEATAGPEAFMHRPSAEGNPDAPLSHHLQDVFHITSTVVGAKLQVNNTTFETSTFSGKEPSPSEVDLKMGKPDSYAFRVGQKLNDNISVGGSYAHVISEHRSGEGAGKKETEQSLAAWITTSHMIKDGTLNTSTIWGQVKNRTDNLTLNSFLEEFVYQLGKNNFYGRFEVLQRTPEQLEIKITDGATGVQWVKALTFGYERNIVSKDKLNMYTGAAATKNFVPSSFSSAYGGNPYAGKVYLRIGWGQKGHHH